jgi:single-strand DNA-binding protein
VERETTEVVLARFRGELTMLDGRGDGGGGYGGGDGGYTRDRAAPAAKAPAAARGGSAPSWEPASGDLDDEIPF